MPIVPYSFIGPVVDASGVGHKPGEHQDDLTEARVADRADRATMTDSTSQLSYQWALLTRRYHTPTVGELQPLLGAKRRNSSTTAPVASDIDNETSAIASGQENARSGNQG